MTVSHMYDSMRERHPAIPGGLALSLLLAYGLLLSSVQANFLFTEEPLVRSSPATGETDLFGYAAVLHRVIDSGDPSNFDRAIMDTKIIVGAPNGTFPGGLNLAGIDGSEAVNDTGLVYVCPITPGDCEPLSGTGSGNDVRLFDHEANTIGADTFYPEFLAQNEEKDGQFMGATIVSSGEHLLVCAPRWVSLNIDDFVHGPVDKTRAHGRCFIAGRDMRNFKLLRPCTRDDSQSLVGEAYCMAGTAATLQELESSSAPSVVSAFLGGPPYDESSGTVFHYALSEAELADTDANMEDFTFIPKKDTLQQFWYSGTAVTVGRIFSQQQKDLIYSLPKNDIYRGSVQVYNLESGAIEAEVFGEQMGEYFGWAVVAADLNGDGFDEVIVGAPLYSTMDDIELGRIFIFKNTMGDFADDPVCIVGTGSVGRYGSAIVNMGDINSDGFEDIAVSAPFVAHEGGAEGTVYIYLGSGGDTIIDTTAVEVITAKDMSELLSTDDRHVNFASFGYSLSSGVDVDANFYNDLVIGDYKQQTVVVLRTQSVANISLSLATNPETLFDYTQRTCTVGPDRFACFSLMITAAFSGRGLDGRALDTKVNVTEKTVSAGRRLFFLNSGGDRTDTFKGFLNFSTTDSPIIQSITVYVENNVADIDRRTPLSLVVGVSSLDRVPREVDGNQSIIDLRDIPLLNVFPQNNQVVELTLEGCIIPDMCRPDLRLSEVQNSIKYLDSKRTETNFTEIVAGAVSFLQVTLAYSTLTEDAVDSFLVLSFPPDVLGAPQSIRSTDNAALLPAAQCQPEGTEGTYLCLVHTIFSNYDGERQVEIVIAISDAVTGEDCGNCTAEFTIFDDDRIIASTSENSVRLPLSISAQADVDITELTINPSSTQYEDTNDLATLITTKITLFNGGPSTIPRSRLQILLPGKTGLTGKYYFLYPHRSSSPPSVTCTGLNPDNLTINSQQQRRRKRGVMESVWREVVGDGEVGDVREDVRKRQEDIQTTVDCSQTPDMCTPIMCDISDFTPTLLSVVVFSYLDNRFFRTQSGNFGFYVHANFYIISDFVEGSSQSKTSNKLVVQEPQKPKSRGVPVWVYIVSGIGGLIALAGIIFLLYMLGFFRLRQKDRIRKEREQLTQSRSGGTATKTTTEPASLDSKPEILLDEGEGALLDEKQPMSEDDEVKKDIAERPSPETEL